MNNNILITGHTGNLGKAVLGYYLDKFTKNEQEYNITGISRSELLHCSKYQSSKEEGYNLTYTVEVQELVRLEKQSFDIIIMCHGIPSIQKLNEFDYNDYLEVIKVNLDSCIRLTSELVQQNKINNNALIIYCGSQQAYAPRAGRLAYAISKSGLETLTKIAAVELAHKRIRVNCLRMGQMDKFMAGIEFTEEEEKRLRGESPLPWIRFEEIAKLIDTLYSQFSLSGEIIHIDGLQRYNIW